MKKLAIIIVGIIVFSGIQSCNKDKCLNGNEYRIGVKRTVDSFNQIDVLLSATVELFPDTSSYVEFIVEGNLEQYIATPVINNVLTLSLSECFSGHQNIVIQVHYDSLNTITISGPGDVKSEEIMIQNELNLNIKSSGSIFLTTNITTLNSLIEGTGLITVNGEIGKHNIEINNSGAVNTYQAMTQNAVVNSNGSGNIYIRVKNTLKGFLNNSGDLYYKRNPTITVVESSTGKVINDN